MKRVLLILFLMLVVWVLAYALAYSLREKGSGGFQYPPSGHLDAALYPFFWPVYYLHGELDHHRQRHERG
jgi:hypothetical protein